jgi:hypothetical protein
MNNNQYGSLSGDYDEGCWMPGDDVSLGEWIHRHTRAAEDHPKDIIDLHVGLDIGYKHDRSCACVIEVQLDSHSEQVFIVRYLKRWRQGLLYPSLVKQVERLYNHLKATGKGVPVSTLFAVDSTGVGEGVSQLIDRILPREYVKHYYITGGISENEDNFGHIHIPKSQMISGIVGAMSSGSLRIPKDIKDGDDMIKELLSYEIHISENTGRDSYNAPAGKFDDMVCSLGLSLACAVRYGRHSDVSIW